MTQNRRNEETKNKIVNSKFNLSQHLYIIFSHTLHLLYFQTHKTNKELARFAHTSWIQDTNSIIWSLFALKEEPQVQH